MERAQIVATLATGYLLGAFAAHRLRVLSRRRSGPSLELLARFDYRVLWNELLAAAAGGDAPAVGEDPSGRDDLEARARLREAIRSVDSREFARARALAAQVDAALAGPLIAAIELANAEHQAAAHRPAAARKAAFAAFEAVGQCRRRTGASRGLDYLSLHLRVAWLTNAVNLEFSLFGALRGLKQAIHRWGDAPELHFSKAHAQALLGRHDEALDEIGRALYYARGDAFYARPILEHPFVKQARPALYAQCKALCEHRGATEAVLSPRETED